MTMVRLTNSLLCAVVVLCVTSYCNTVLSFQSSSILVTKESPTTTRTYLTKPTSTTSSRREFFKTTTDECSLLSIFAIGITSISVLPEQAFASGGATAGGAYLLSAKQRYNTRVTKGVANFIGLKSTLEKNDIDTIRTYFASDDDGAWKDFTSAGYLLANAFRTSSSTKPDSLPSVKKWKAFTSQVEEMTKALKKKDIPAALKAHSDAIVALDDYLSKVELST